VAATATPTTPAGGRCPGDPRHSATDWQQPRRPIGGPPPSTGPERHGDEQRHPTDADAPAPRPATRPIGRNRGGQLGDRCVPALRSAVIGTVMGRSWFTSYAIGDMWWWMLGSVAKSHYKGPWIGKTPMCILCGGPGTGSRAEHRMTHGISVWLCEAHRDGAFQRRRAGRDFVAILAAVWSAAGAMNRRRSAALSAHLRRIRQPHQRPRPGSYAWPDLRRDAERRFADGETVDAVARHLARRTGTQRRPGPSRRTIRRWRSDGRWLAAHARRAPTRELRREPPRHVTAGHREPDPPAMPDTRQPQDRAPPG